MKRIAWVAFTALGWAGWLVYIGLRALYEDLQKRP